MPRQVDGTHRLHLSRLPTEREQVRVELQGKEGREAGSRTSTRSPQRQLTLPLQSLARPSIPRREARLGPGRCRD